jgi:hypothetical protein
MALIGTAPQVLLKYTAAMASTPKAPELNRLLGPAERAIRRLGHKGA